MRKHRVNLNLLCDHDMASFLTNTPLLVEQLLDITYINLFLTELRSLQTDKAILLRPCTTLSFTHSVHVCRPWIDVLFLSFREDDVTITMYSTGASRDGNGSVSQNRHQSSGASKVNTVCDVVIATLTTLGENQ